MPSPGRVKSLICSLSGVSDPMPLQLSSFRRIRFSGCLTLAGCASLPLQTDVSEGLLSLAQNQFEQVPLLFPRALPIRAPSVPCCDSTDTRSRFCSSIGVVERGGNCSSLAIVMSALVRIDFCVRGDLPGGRFQESTTWCER